ncbi:hypothetical protein L208DRAFT_1484723 [Tricholoma matsutake]|nr:hypothetical protein L208DRAFT_1484723 [Tricholoma matsutake 945]
MTRPSLQSQKFKLSMSWWSILMSSRSISLVAIQTTCCTCHNFLCQWYSLVRGTHQICVQFHRLHNLVYVFVIQHGFSMWPQEIPCTQVSGKNATKWNYSSSLWSIWG